jgi:hypothetical protein
MAEKAPIAITNKQDLLSLDFDVISQVGGQLRIRRNLQHRPISSDGGVVVWEEFAKVAALDWKFFPQSACAYFGTDAGLFRCRVYRASARQPRRKFDLIH